jgi:ATP synthase protein I
MNGNDADGKGHRPGQTPSEGDLSARLKRLETALDAKQPPAPPPGQSSGSSTSQASSLGRAFRLSTEFVAGVIAGGGIGWFCDHWLGTKPWGMIVFLMLGFGAGVFNVMRAAGFLTQSDAGPGNKAGPRGPDGKR